MHRIELTDDLSYIYEDIARVNKKAAEGKPAAYTLHTAGT